MDIIGDSAREDRAITNEAEDRLERGPFVKTLVRALVRDIRDAKGNLTRRKSTGFVVGLTGAWGLGKSSVLKLLSLELGSMSQVMVVTFNPWLFKGRDELVSAYFNLLRAAITQSDAKNAKKLRDSLEKYWSAIDYAGQAVSAFADVQGGLGFLGGAWRAGSRAFRAKLFGKKSADTERENLETMIQASNSAIVILIDELDRVEDDEVRAVAQLVKAVGEIKGISYLVAYDPGRVAEALGRGPNESERKISGEAYLEKIIQYAIPLRPLIARDVDALLAATLKEHDIALPEPTTHQAAILSSVKHAVRTPRDVKRLVGAYATLEEMLRGEIGSYDILAYSWLTTKSPTLRDAIANHAEQLVDDPDEEEMTKRILTRLDRSDRGISSHDPLSLVDILGEQARRHERVLKLIFPRFDDDKSSRSNMDEPAASNRLSKRRNLLRALYLGNPPGMVSRRQVEATWSLTDPVALAADLNLKAQEQTLREVIDRIGELFVELPPLGDLTFWPVLAKTLVRNTDWARGPDEDRWIADDATAVLIQQGSRPGVPRERVKASIASLIEAGDVVIVPAVLRKNLFAHGMTKHSKSGGGETIYSRQEMLQLLETEIPRYRRALLDGTLLRRIPNVEALFAISNRSQWDTELHSSLTEQLNSIEAIATFAALVVPPGYSIDRSSLAELFDVGAVLARTEELHAQGAEIDDVWLSGCLKRLTAIMRGRDPDFDLAEDNESQPASQE